MSKSAKIVSIVLKVIVVAIMLMVAMNKLLGAPGAIYLFEQLGQEPVGRYAVGIIELVVAILILIPKTTAIGGIVGFFTMIGAMLSHIKLGSIAMVDPEGVSDGGMMFMMAVVVLVACAVLAYLHRASLPFLKSK